MKYLLLWLGVSVSLSCLFVACEEDVAQREPQETAQPEAQPDSVEDECVEGAFRAAKLLGKTLKTRLIEAMGEGLEPAVRVCADEAQSIHRRVAEQTGVRVGRASTKLRNPANTPPAWVATYLSEHSSVGAPLKTRVGNEAHVAIPLEAAGMCLSCHGESVSDEVRAVLEDRYPDDEATGYHEGDLRGVIWAEKSCPATSSR